MEAVVEVSLTHLEEHLVLLELQTLVQAAEAAVAQPMAVMADQAL